MDYKEILYNRIQQLEPEHASKIIHHLLLLHNGDRDVIWLACCPDDMIHSLINKAKPELGLSTESGFGSSLYSGWSPPAVSVSPPTQIRNPSAFEFVQTRMQFLNLEGVQLEPVNHHSIGKDIPGSFCYPEQQLPVRTNRRSPSLPVKVCYYFNRGNCKYGNNCRFIHPQLNSSEMYNPNFNDEDHVILPGSLRELESEIIDLLKSQGGLPVSIASLPMLYSVVYRKPLQAEGYVTESQRQGKSGYNLTKLLARLSNNICVIDRPHGQHSVILADHRKSPEYPGERKEEGGTVPASQQIYLTFPADSTFTVQDVINYFSKFGPVQDVRIPKQHKRMFGFVTFDYATTVQQILSRGNPHFVCTSRVLVKPYKEKSRLVDRKFNDTAQHSVQYGSRYMDRDAEMQNSIPPRAYRTFWEKQYSKEKEQYTYSFVPPYSMIREGSTDDDLKLAYDAGQVEHSDFMLDALNSESFADDRISNIRTNYKDIDSQDLNLPESPFSVTGVSTVA